ncbi:hypothetical protein [Convivina intestini]|uniref:hypothetical protein n=1 Tax=Convivina intestini TaxID=1505726 RepID=UPI00200FFC88|nr:hypothetical protein [Convivina intestini]CAH1855704.1 hypothetical protein R077811_01098 [Convivina intestini]
MFLIGILVIVFAMYAFTAKLASWIPWLALLAGLCMILDFVLDHWIISIILLVAGLGCYGFYVSTTEEGKEGGDKFYQKLWFKPLVSFLVFFLFIFTLANTVFSKNNNSKGHEESQSAKTSSSKESSSSSSEQESSSSSSVSNESNSSSQEQQSSQSFSSDNQNDNDTTVYVADNGKSSVYWYNTDQIPHNTNKSKIVTMTEAEAKQQGKRLSAKD